MALARRLGGRTAAWVTGLYLALSPKFLTVFSLNCVGQYVDILALGGLALALLARLLDEPGGPEARWSYLALGLLLGAAFWQQPVALAYCDRGRGRAGRCAARRGATRGPPLVGAGLVLGVLPVLLWNLRNDWDSSFILGRDPSEVQAQIAAIPVLAERAVSVAFPVLAGLSPGHPWGAVALVRLAATALLPLLLVAYLAARGRDLARSLRDGRPTAGDPAAPADARVARALLVRGRRHGLPATALPAARARRLRDPPGRARRPGLAPALAARRSSSRSWPPSWPLRSRAPRPGSWRHGPSPPTTAGSSSPSTAWRSAPPTPTSPSPPRSRCSPASGSCVSPRLGPTPAYESESLARRVDLAGPDAYILPPGDDPELFAAELRRHGVSFKTVLDPLPVFYDLHPRIRAEEVRGFRGEAPAPRGAPDE